MKTIEDPRVSAYLDWVARNYAEDVVSSLRRKIESVKNLDPDKINLSSLLKQAKSESTKTLDLVKDLTLGINSHCRS